MQVVAVLLFMGAVVAEVIFLFMFIVNKIRKKNTDKIKRNMLFSLALFVLSIVLFVVFGNSDKEKNKTEKEQQIVLKSTENETVLQGTENNAEKHIYDNAVVKDVINGTRDKKIGEYSIIESLSDEINETVLTDWYYNYVKQNNYNWCMILFTDTNDGNGTYLGAYAIENMVEMNVKYSKNQYGDYSMSDMEGVTIYLPENGVLSEFVGREE